MSCLRPECEHMERDHNESGCRRTGCPCEGLLLPEETKTVVGRRVCIDVPDGYMLSVSLVPYTEGSAK